MFQESIVGVKQKRVLRIAKRQGGAVRRIGNTRDLRPSCISPKAHRPCAPVPHSQIAHHLRSTAGEGHHLSSAPGCEVLAVRRESQRLGRVSEAYQGGNQSSSSHVVNLNVVSPLVFSGH